MFNQSKINKSILASVIILGLLLTSIFAALPVKAQETAHGGNPTAGYEGPITIPAGSTADFTINPLALLSVTPNPIGVGQELLVNMWITFPSGEGKYMAGYKVTITAPDGTKVDVNLRSYVADGTSWFTYVPTQVGDYKFQFFFAGEYFVAGYYQDGLRSDFRNGTFSGAIYNPSDYITPANSNIVVVTVQSDMVSSWHSPLPNDYWTRPIQPNNREWAAIGGNYPWGQRMGGTNSWNDENYGPFITAPNTPHIVWKRVGALAGIIGGETGNYATLSSPGSPSVIYMGRAYQTVTKVMPTYVNSTLRQQPVSVAECYDIRTGVIYYDIPIADGGITPTHIAYWREVDTAVPGAGEASSYGVELHTVSGGRLYKINPLTGAITTNISLGVAPGTITYEMAYRDGYYLTWQRIGVNNTINPGGAISVPKSSFGFMINWTEQGSSTNFTTRIVSNVSIPILPDSYRTLYEIGSYGILGAFDWDTGITVVQSRFVLGGFYGSIYEALDLSTGKIIWNISTPVNLMESAYRPTNAWARHGIYTAEMERGYWQARNIRTGAILWETQMNDMPWGEFWMYDEAADGTTLYGVGYTGVWAINEVTGAVVWHYVDDTAPPFEMPYTSANGTLTSYCVQAIRIADGKIYVANDEHTPSQPATRGWGLIALNLTTGEKLWKISGTRMSPGAAADGYMFTASSYDGTMYVLGKGKSATTVTTPDVEVPLGTGVLIKGTVLDMSPAQPGTPAISDDTMDTWMDYLQLQMPSDGYYHNITVKGVPVALYAIDSNGNPVSIGTATSDTSGSYQIEWTPPAEGLYKITATFAGSDSYGSSWAETGLSIGSAPTVAPTPTPISSDSATSAQVMTYVAGATVAIIIAIALVGLLLFRKHA